MKRIYFVRHGESLANAGGITMENAAIPLSEQGQRQAEAVADLLPREPALVLVSPMLRTQQTAEPYCRRRGAQPTVQPTLAEFSMICATLIAGFSGEQRRPVAEAYWADADPWKRLGPNADTFIEFDARVGDFIDLMPELPDGTVIFGHGIWFALLQWRLLGMRSQDAPGMKAFRHFQQGFSVPNCAVFCLRWQGLRWSTERVAHAESSRAL